MKCAEAAEYVSALYDGERVPPEAAEHMARCADCRELLKGYAEMGAALRSYGSLLLAEPVPERAWPTTGRNTTKWWEKGLGMMRIPRIAFACLVLLLFTLGSRLALVEVRAHEDGSVLLLKMTPTQGEDVLCDVSTADAEHDHCGGLSQISKSNLFFSVRALGKDGDRALLSVRLKVTPQGPASFDNDTTPASLPEQQVWFTPGRSLPLQNTGELRLVLTGQWADHITVGSHALLDPGPNEIRLTAPLLLKNNQVVGDMPGGGASATDAGDYIFLFIPNEGRFVLSLMPIAGAVPAKVELSRVSFESNGQKFVLLSGMPLIRGEKMWVLHDNTYKPSGDSRSPVIGSGSVSDFRRPVNFSVPQ